MTKYYNHLAVGLDEVRRNFEAYGMLDDQVKFLKGWFKDTLPNAPVRTISVLRLDGDYYESTRDALSNLYDKVSPGGYLIIDDYGENSWTYCRKAVDEFRLERGITDRSFESTSHACTGRKRGDKRPPSRPRPFKRA